jgi:hypothetical protein
MPTAPKKEGAPRLVSDYIDASTASWKAYLISKFFLLMDAEVIIGIPLCTRIQEDFSAWHFEKTVLFGSLGIPCTCKQKSE